MLVVKFQYGCIFAVIIFWIYVVGKVSEGSLTSSLNFPSLDIFCQKLKKLLVYFKTIVL